MAKIFEIKSVKGVIIKNLFEVIKPYIKETVLVIDNTGIKMNAVDISGKSLTHVKLDADKFEIYNCKRFMKIGIDTTIFFKTIRSVSRSETLEFYMDEGHEDKLGVKLTDLSGKIKDYKLPLLLLDANDIKYPDEVEFESMINIPSSQFQEIIKIIHSLEGRVIDIKSLGRQLIFESKDGAAEFKTMFNELGDVLNEDQQELLKQNGEKIKTVKFIKSSIQIVQGRFEVSYLMNFIKASHLCDNMVLLFENDKPLTLEYQVADIGILRMMLASCDI